MQHRNYIKFVFCLLCLPFQLLAQQEERDVTGLWKGFMYNDTTQKNMRYEIAISEEKGKLYGYSHTYFILDDKEYHGIKKLKVKRDGNEITTEDDELIVHNYPVAPAKGIHQQNKLVLEIKGSIMLLSGFYATNRTKNYAPATGFVHVERTNDYRQSALVPHLQELNLAKNLTFIPAENTSPAEETIAILKPIKSDEEEKLIVATAKKQERDMTIKPGTIPVIVKPEPIIVKTEIPKPEEPVIVKTTPAKTTEPVVVKTEPVKVTPPVVTKPAPVKPAEPAVVQATPTVKKTEPVIVKPAPAKPAEPVVVKTEPVKVVPPVVAKPVPGKPAEPAIVQATPTVKKTEPVIVKPAPAKPTEPVVVKTAPVIVAPPVILPPVKKADPADVTAAMDVNKRKVETIQAVYFKSDSLELTLYDNGEVDGDTVSVVMNGQVIMPKVGLSTKAFKKTIDTKAAGDSIQLIMYAESLGSLPPNTGLLIVYDGKDRYEIRFSGDMQKSSAIVFRRRKN
jgi:hypothetical protein